MTSTERKTYHYLCPPCEIPFHRNDVSESVVPYAVVESWERSERKCPECNAEVEPISCPLCGNGEFHAQHGNRWCTSETCTYMETGDGF